MRRGSAASVARAALRGAISLLLASVAVFTLLRLVPGDPVLIALAEGAQAADPATVEDWRRGLGLIGSWPAQYVSWLGAFLSGDWGLSLRTRRPVALEIADRIGWSCAIGVGGLALSALLSLPLGRRAALHPDGPLDALSRFGSVALQAVPAFAIGLGIVWLASARPGTLRLYTGDAAERLVVPVMLVCLYSLIPLLRVTRRSFLDQAARPHMLVAQAKGLDAAHALRRHGTRASALALIAALPPQATWVIGGTVTVEVVFAIPGVSQLVVDSVTARDYTVLQAFVMLVASGMAVLHVAADALRHLIDPRPDPWRD